MNRERQIETIDLTQEPNDHFTSLPPELLHLVFGYLFPTHSPDKAFREEDRPSNSNQRTTPHPLECLASTCTSLRGEIDAWAHHFLVTHQSITKYAPLKTSARQAVRNHLRLLLAWTQRHCIFCGKKSARSAILMNGLRCCSTCDRVHWPDKITKTAARDEYCLKDHHLLPHQHIGVWSQGVWKGVHPWKCPKIRYGTYMSSGVATTIFLRSEVETLATFLHGNLKNFLAMRRESKEERRRRKEAKQQKSETVFLSLPPG